MTNKNKQKGISKLHNVCGFALAVLLINLHIVYVPMSVVYPAVFPRRGCWSPVEQSSLSQPRCLSTHTLPESETNKCVN